MASYVMQLSGPPQLMKPPVSFLGVTTPITAHPIILLLGVIAGGYLATRKTRKR